jgi:hypothetical protein
MMKNSTASRPGISAAEQRDHVGLDDDGVDDEHDRRRNEDAEGAAGGERAGRQRRLVAVALQLGQGDLAHGGGGRGRGAADRAEAAAGGDRRHGDAAAEPADPGIGAAEKVVAEAAAIGEPAHENEHGEDREVVVRELRVGEVLELAEQDRRTGEDAGADQPDQDHRIGDGHADRDQRQQGNETEDADDEAGVHGGA